MTLWLIEPQDPLIVRDGRPFNATPGARARSLPFPFPSTVSGGVRTRAGQDANGQFDKANIPDVKQVNVRGPLLVELGSDGAFTFMAPAPADALVFGNKKALCRKWLRPLTLADGADNDKEHGLLHLVGLPRPDPRKPAKNAPAFWRWQKFEEWLTDPADDAVPSKPTELGHNGPQPDQRVHVAIDPSNFTGLDGALFLTSGLTFWYQELRQEKEDESSVATDYETTSLSRIGAAQEKKEDDSSSADAKLSLIKKLALAIDVDNLNGLSISEGMAPLGGERRLMHWRQPVHQELPQMPPGLAEKIVEHGGFCRLVLLTPAYFSTGWRPDHFGSTPGATVTLLAAAVGSPTVVSGWDFDLRQPKPTRRLVPAGSVYFVKVEGGVRQWLNERWLNPLSDDVELARAGFGLTAVGFWDGTAQPIQIDLQEANNG